jgi:release factor glutamine methyltransferase
VAAGEELPPVVRDWEPTGALISGPTGLEALELLVAEAPGWLDPAGTLVLELAPHQGDAVAATARAAGFAEVLLRHDLTGRIRTLIARRRAD